MNCDDTTNLTVWVYEYFFSTNIKLNKLYACNKGLFFRVTKRPQYSKKKIIVKFVKSIFQGRIMEGENAFQIQIGSMNTFFQLDLYKSDKYSKNCEVFIQVSVWRLSKLL